MMTTGDEIEKGSVQVKRRDDHDNRCRALFIKLFNLKLPGMNGMLSGSC
jgi:hypothetical protein